MICAIVADSRRLRIFAAAAGKAPVEIAAFVNVDAGKHERDLVSDRPGRVINSASGGHQSYQPKVSASEHALRMWLKSVATSVSQVLEERAPAPIVLLAAPRLLPRVLRNLPQAIQRRVCEKVPVDVARQPAAMLTPRIDSAMRAAARHLSAPSRVPRFIIGRRSKPRLSSSRERAVR
jgi:protein required for attachment to host cells